MKIQLPSMDEFPQENGWEWEMSGTICTHQMDEIANSVEVRKVRFPIRARDLYWSMEDAMNGRLGSI